MSSDFAHPPLVYGPGKNHAAYVLAVTGLLPPGVFVALAWIPFSVWLEHGDTSALPSAAGLLVIALALAALSILTVRKVLTKVVITLTDNGLVIDTSGPFAKPRQKLLWGDLDRIDLGAKHRGLQHIWVHPAPRTGRKRLRVLNHQLGVPLLDVVQGIADRAGAAGYRLEGGPLKNPVILTQKWRVVKG
ncbi:MAG: hypothetical protein JJU24_07710 [Natronohydrobacter sp.]|nr:hypothetical protein [Natronohydrobacter sp.]